MNLSAISGGNSKKRGQREEILNTVRRSAEWAAPMDCLFGRVVLILSISAFLAGGDSAVAGNPIGDFFKRLGNSIAPPRSSPAPRQTPPRTTGKKQNENERAPSPGMSPGAPPAPPVPTPTPMPVPLLVRSAAGVPPAKRSRRDMPYGIPVPNKPGFVTSPYAPKSGLVDVRGFPSGTEVKDPYTGKTFLTP